MKRFGLPVATLGLLVMTPMVLYASGWFTPRAQQGHLTAIPQASVHDQRPSDAALHYRQNSPNHWRTCLLER